MTHAIPTAPSATDPLPELIRALRHRLAATRLQAVKAIGKRRENALDATSALLAALNDDDDSVREAAARAIGQLGPTAVPTIAKMLGNPDKYVRRHAVWALGKLGPQAAPALPDLCRALRDSDPRTASGAAQALGELGPAGASAVPDLAEAMRGTNVVLCRLAAKALSQIGAPAFSTLLVHLTHHDPFVKGEAAMAVGWMGPSAAPAVTSLVGILCMCPPTTATRPAVEPKSESSSVEEIPPGPVDTARIAAATALGRIGPAARDAVPSLVKYENDGCPGVKSAVVQALRLIRRN
jgi:HEAT repeat protein